MSNHVYAQTPKLPAFRVSKTCLPECQDSTAATIFKDTITTTKATTWTWDFGDPNSGAKNTSKLKNPAHLYSSPGDKIVTLTRTVGGVIQPPIIHTVTINEPPKPFYLGNSPSQQDTTICKGDFLTLDPYKGGGNPKYKYIWYPKGDTTQTLRADTTSCYSVQVTDSTTGCSAQNKINVKLCVPPPPKPPENYWYFGNNAGIKFSNGSATADTKGKIVTKEGVSSITDNNGNLLFYTDGKTIYFKDGIPMASLTKDSLGGSSLSTQSAVIVPQPSCQGCQSIYYVFTTTEINGKKQLSYSVVDIRQNKGQGKVIEKNVVLDDEPSTEQVISHFVKKDSTYWVISHDYGTDSIRLRRVTKNGVSVSTVIKIGSRIDSTFKGEGYLKVSKDGTKIAVAIPGGARNLVEVYDFSDSTGAITNKKVIDLGPAPPMVYGIEFSPDSKTLFATMKADTVKKKDSYSSLLRFDLTSGDSTSIAKSKFTIDSSKKEYYGAVQLGPDGKIYLAVQGSTFLGIVKVPNDTVSIKSLNKDYYERNGLNLNGKTSQLGLPTNFSENQTKSEGIGISAPDTCFGSPTTFQTNHLCGDKLKNSRTDWRFYRGDPPPQGQNPIGPPIATIQGGDGDKGLQTSYTFDAPGKYYVVVNMGNRCKPDTMLPPQPFEVKPLPKPDLGPDIELCANSVTLDSKVKLDSTHYFWFQNRKFLPKDSLQTLNVKQSGSYIVVVENRGCVGADSIKVILAKAKALSLGPDTLICVGSPITLDASNAAGTGSTYLWSTGATSAKIIVGAAGRYIVTVTTPIGNTTCKTSDTVNVRVRPKPVFSITKTPPTACNSANGEIKINGLSPAYTFTWTQNGVILPTNGVGDGLIGLKTGTYKVTFKSLTSCDTTISIVLNSTATPNAIITPTPVPVTCISDGEIKIVVASNSAFKPTSFILRQKSDDVIVKQGVMASIFVKNGEYAIKGLFEGTYYIEFKNAVGCQFTSPTTTLSKVPRTEVSLLPAPTGKCEGDSIKLSPLNYKDGSIRWSTGATTLNITVGTSGKYTVTVTSPDGKCRSVANSNVVFTPAPKVNITAPSRLCLTPFPTQLIASPSGGTWAGSNVNSAGVFSINAIGIYDVRYEVTQSGCKGKDRKEITVLDAPVFDLGSDKSLCRGNNTDFIGISTPQTGVNYRWSSGETTPTIFPERTGRYTLTAIKGLCKTVDDISVTILPSPFVNLRDEIPFCVPSTLPVRLDAGGGVGLSYLWSPGGQKTRQISVNNIGNYSVKVTNSSNCSTTAQTKVIDRCDPSILVPEIITPNGDNLNDNFQVFPFYIREYDLKIFNRWGELIFTSRNPEDRWDGKYKGILVKPDSFAWVITYIPEYFPEQGLKRKEGAVVVVW